VINDALVESGIIAGDKPKYVSVPVPQQIKIKAPGKEYEWVELEIWSPPTSEDFRQFISMAKRFIEQQK